MSLFIALLRGINVGGKNKLKMADLKILIEELGFKNVQTYIQSGNVILESTLNDPLIIGNQMSQAILKKFNYSVDVLVLTKLELETLFYSNPFLKRNEIDLSKLHVTILKEKPHLTNHSIDQKFVKSINDEYIIEEKNVFIYCPNGYGKTKLTTTFFEKKLNSQATTRNWKTISKLVDLIS